MRRHHKLTTLLAIAGLARSTFYYQGRALERTNLDDAMRQGIRDLYNQHKGRYGYRRITMALRKDTCQAINHKRVQRLMRQMGLQARIRRARKRYHRGNTLTDVQAPNILQRDFRAAAPRRKWSTDMTEFGAGGSKLYLSACMDLFNGEIVGYRMAARPVFELATGTISDALQKVGGAAGVVLHSDQGWHYKMPPYRALLARHGITQSMSRKGNCLDNAPIESFFGTLKVELFRLQTFTSTQQLEAAIHDYIRYYNHERIKLRLDGLSPVEYRLRWAA